MTIKTEAVEGKKNIYIYTLGLLNDRFLTVEIQEGIIKI